VIHHWIVLRASGVPIGFANVAGMAIRGTLKRPLVQALIVSHQAELDFDHRQLEAHFLAGGDVEGVVKAALALRRLGQTVDPAALLALDLSDRRLPELVRAYARARERYPDLSFEEVMRRHLEGEDVIAAVDRGAFVPNAQRTGWGLRVEYDVRSEAELNRLISALRESGTVYVRSPGTEAWRKVARP
jgi:hypothetical protein